MNMAFAGHLHLYVGMHCLKSKEHLRVCVSAGKKKKILKHICNTRS